MDRAQSLLFGDAPRRVGTPVQHWVYAADQVDLFIDAVNGRRNAYATVCRWDFDTGEEIADKVLYDLDSPAKDEEGDWKLFDDEPPDDEVVDMMRGDPDVADRILGKVCEDARAIARRCRDDNVPCVGVFSGFGIHVHQLFKPSASPATAMATTANAYLDRLDLQTPDRSILGQPERICRIPNCERIADSVKSGDYGLDVEDGRPCGLYTIPLSRDELAAVDPEWLLDVSHSPRTPDSLRVSERPEMRVWQEYETGMEEEADIPPRPLDPDQTAIAEDDDLRVLLEELLRMPCMVERLLDDPNPDHDVRVNATVLLLNTGMPPAMVVDIFEQINWIDFDRQQTEKYVRGIYQNPVSDMRCETLRSRGLCVRSEDPESCPTYGWSGGQPEWTS